MSNTYRFKHRLFPRLIPVAVPAIAPLSLASAWAIHACQQVSLNYKFYRARRHTRTDVPPDAGGETRTQAECVSRLPLNDFKPLNIDGYTSTGLRAWTDIGPMYFDSGRIFRGRFHRYPHHFHETLIPTRGTPISGMMGLHHAKLPRPGLLIVHGLMNSKRQDLVRVVTLRAFYEWGFNVCAIDMRGFGRSSESVSLPTGGGSIEADDVIDVVKYLKQFPHFTSIGLLGFSLGGGAVLNAAATREAESLIDGAVMAVSAPINYEASLNRFEEPPEDHEHLMTYHFFQYLLRRSLDHSEFVRWARKKGTALGLNPEVNGFYDYLRNMVAWFYLAQGRERPKDPDTLLKIFFRLASPVRKLGQIKVPTFLLHAKDDPMTRITEDDIANVQRVCRTSPYVRCHVTERGGHTAYVVVNPTWFYDVVRKYFTYWGKWEVTKVHPGHIARSLINQVGLMDQGGGDRQNSHTAQESPIGQDFLESPILAAESQEIGETTANTETASRAGALAWARMLRQTAHSENDPSDGDER